MRTRLYLGLLLASPITIVTCLFYVLPFWLFGWHTLEGVKSSTTAKSPLGTALVWAVNVDKAPAWLLKLWEGWGGHCLGSVIVLCKPLAQMQRGDVLLNHELHHAHQVHTLGLLQPILYGLSSLIAYVSGERSYTTNHFEMAARRAAGQVVDAQSFAQGYMWVKTDGNKK